MLGMMKVSGEAFAQTIVIINEIWLVWLMVVLGLLIRMQIASQITAVQLEKW